MRGLYMLFTEEQLNKIKEMNKITQIKNQQKQRQIIRENIWYKLYMLQNYTVTKNMFIGSTLRWKSIETYAGFVRAIYRGEIDEFTTRAKYTKSLIKYVKGLMDSGVEPYPAPKIISKFKKTVSVDYLIKNNLITKHQAREIYFPVSEQKNLPDTSIAWTRTNYGINRHEYNTGSYYKIVPEEKRDFNFENGNINKVTNPLSSNNKFNPFKFNLHKDFNLAEAFKQI